MPSLPHTQLSSQSLPLSDSEVTSARPHWRTRATRRLVSGLAIGTIFTALLLVTSFKSDVGWNGHGHLPHDELHEIDIPPAPFKGSVADITQLRPKRVAIVGAGASGSSAAFFLRRAARIMEERIGAHEGAMLGEVVVVDKEGYVGGREFWFVVLKMGRGGVWGLAERRGGEKTKASRRNLGGVMWSGMSN